MRTRNFLLGLTGGIVAGYTAYRTYEAVTALSRPKPSIPSNAARYGATRRALALAGIARSMAGASSIALGPFGEAMERRVRRAPVWLQPALFAAQVSLIDGLFDLPTEFIEGHELERQYGLSEQSMESWLSDYVKEQIIGSAVTAFLAGLLGAALRRWPRTWPFIASIATFPLLVLANIIVPIYVLPLFNKYVPIEGPLEERLRALASRFGAGDAEILRVDMSKQTKKANAFVIGIAGTHRIVVGDTLIEHFTPEEIEFVVAHELGHFVSNDTWRLIAIGELTASAIIFSAYFALGEKGRKEASNPRTLARIQFFALLGSQLLRPALAAFSRSREWAADRFALRTTRDPKTGAAALRRLRDQNLAEDEQPAWFELLFSTHPSLKARIAALDPAQAGS